MTPAAWITLFVVTGFVWGGFLLLVAIALRKEHTKAGLDKGLWVP